MNLFLNHEGFEEHLPLKAGVAALDGVQYIFRFANGYGASVIKHMGSYGSRQDLWELAVIKFYGDGYDDWHLNYDTPITDDVLGYLTDEDVRNHLSEIKAL